MTPTAHLPLANGLVGALLAAPTQDKVQSASDLTDRNAAATTEIGKDLIMATSSSFWLISIAVGDLRGGPRFKEGSSGGGQATGGGSV